VSAAARTRGGELLAAAARGCAAAKAELVGGRVQVAQLCEAELTARLVSATENEIYEVLQRFKPVAFNLLVRPYKLGVSLYYGLNGVEKDAAAAATWLGLTLLNSFSANFKPFVR